ncbi:MAG TPA: chemotaxis protein CheX [Planctomycetaceae bacterium]|jgi:CheY-specific phosphatase CheX|nr:chemotaxis protein CheX [Planctomycetaceae bacterium]
MSEIAAEGSEPVSAEMRETLLNPFITATSAALGEMANTEVTVQAMSRGPGRRPLGYICAELRLTTGIKGSLVLVFPKHTAETLAKRMLAGVSIEVGEQLIRDCAGEIGNVVAGQAKALLAASPYHFAFSLPTVVDVTNFQPPPGLDCLIVAFNGDSGDFALQLFLKL